MSDEGSEPKYTLAKARAEIAKQECEMEGHLFEVLVFAGHGEPNKVVCARCGRSWRIEEAG
jgi:hypothetical protein